MSASSSLNTASGAFAPSFARYAWPRDDARQRTVTDWEFGHSELEPEGVAPTFSATADITWHPASAFPSMIQWESYVAGIAEPAPDPLALVGDADATSAPGHPYVGTNSETYRWTSNATWWFRTTVPHNALAQGSARAELVFDGVDHDAWVWIDGQLVDSHAGMFGGPVVDVSPWLQDCETTDHEVIVALRPAGLEQGKPGWGHGGRLVKAETFCRWTNNADFMTTGIWQPVRLVQTGAFRLERPHITTRLLPDDFARVSVEVEVLRADVQADLHWVQRHGGIPPVWDPRFVQQEPSASPVSAEVTVSILDPSGTTVASATTTADVTPGRVWAHADLDIADPHLWWPSRVGEAEPSLHTVVIELDGPAQDSLRVRTGLREIKWARSEAPRSSDHWFDWTMEINGIATPVRGINWMPMDLLRFDRARYEHMLGLIKDAGIQLVRVWGGGLVETEDFYDVCDELGLMVWQDFPLNTFYDCSEIPLEVWEQQVVWSVERLRNRASLVLWCGGNELDPYAPENAAVVGIMERTIADLDGTRPFFRSCSDPGDVHPYLECDSTWYHELYREAPAISEWGGHTLPSVSTLAEILPAEELDRSLKTLLSSEADALASSHPVLRRHWAEFDPDRVPRMLSRARLFDDLARASFEQAVLAVQLGAAEIYQTIITDFSAGDCAQTNLMPWVYNRPWPSVGMQAVDHSGRPTLGYYAIKRGFHPGALVLRPEHEALAPGEALDVEIGLTWGADGNPAAPRPCELVAYDQDLRVLTRRSMSVSFGEFEHISIDVPSASHAVILVAMDPDEPEVQHVRVIRIAESLADESARRRYRASPQTTAHFMDGSLREAVAAQPTSLAVEIEPLDRGAPADSVSTNDRLLTASLTNHGDVPAAYVTLESSDPRWLAIPEDNGFWIEPGMTRGIGVTLRRAAEVSTITTAIPETNSAVDDAIAVRGWNL